MGGQVSASSLSALHRDFYLLDTVATARNLLNCILIRATDTGLVSGRITETEAYTQCDPASHSFRGRTDRNAPMFGPPGHSYVYIAYGMYHCLNAVTSSEGSGDAVLIRAAEPIDGWELMSRRRGLAEEDIERLNSAGATTVERVRRARALCGGPGKLCQAFGITLADNGLDLTIPGEIWIAPSTASDSPRLEEVRASPRIGIRSAAEVPWRFTLQGDPYASRRDRLDRSGK